MTGLLRTSLFFFLPIFGALLIYHYSVSTGPSWEERKATFRESHSELLGETRTVAEGWIAENKSGQMAMPNDLEAAGLILAEVVRESQPVMTLISSPLLEAGNWSLYPDPKTSPAHISKFRFSVGSETSNSEIETVLFEETIYQADGNPVRLNVFIKGSEVSSND